MAISGGQQRLDWYAVPGVPLTIVLDTADGADWASAPIVHVGPIEADGDITPVIPAQTATITATASRATLTLTDAQMAAILTAYPVAARTACPWHVRLGTGESELAVSTGHIIWDTTGRMVTASAQLVVGPAGLTAVSADAGNPLAATVTHDGKTWESLTPFNVWAPGVSGWRELVTEGYPAWVQPTGAHDAYAKGARVSFEGSDYESRIDGNVWSPTAYPAGWLKL